MLRDAARSGVFGLTLLPGRRFGRRKAHDMRQALKEAASHG